ncbi:MAG: dihydroorotase [Elusimicrobia bacterium]|nr:dihydroorotase [Elusimicrobiota bacterium]
MRVSGRLLIRGGRVVDPRHGRDEVLDILIADERVRRVAKMIPPPKRATVVDARGLIVTPGLIDLHVHLREPGQEEKETIATGTVAAALGGFTSVVCMANTIPPLDNVSEIQFVQMKARTEGRVRVYPVGAISRNLAGQELAEIGAMRRAGCVAISDDGQPVKSAMLFRRALEYAKNFHLVVIDHCEEPELARDGVMNEGRLATILGLKGIPRQAEYIMVARDIALAELTRGRVHLAHLSTKESVEFVRQAKARGVQVTAETCPHYFCLTEEAVTQYNTLAKMNPPLRTAADVEAIKQGISDGTLDVIASDHAPHTASEKAREFDLAPFGIIGLETTLPLVITHLIDPGLLSWSEAVRRLSEAPARLLELPGGHLGVGAPGDVTVIDPRVRHTVTGFVSKSRNSPFLGWTLKGKARMTIVAGDIVMDRGRVV